MHAPYPTTSPNKPARRDAVDLDNDGEIDVPQPAVDVVSQPAVVVAPQPAVVVVPGPAAVVLPRVPAHFDYNDGIAGVITGKSIAITDANALEVE